MGKYLGSKSLDTLHSILTPDIPHVLFEIGIYANPRELCLLRKKYPSESGWNEDTEVFSYFTSDLRNKVLARIYWRVV